MKYIFVTGGVVSGLGKGITAASLGRLLKSRGYKVISQKLDPYINVDPGTMSPLEHGEVFITDDGAETDLDLGHYERFVDENLNKYSSLTTGRVYNNVISKERRGEFLGKTIQVIPHITNEIKSYIRLVGERSQAEIVITEIGGTTGDIESLPYIEAIRQLAREVGRNNCVFIHVTLVPFLESSLEFKSKPTQHSVKELNSLGIFPDFLVLRSNKPLNPVFNEKISQFCNVDSDCIIGNSDVRHIYEIPVMLEKKGFSLKVCQKLGLEPREIDMKQWEEMLNKLSCATKVVKIALVGKYIQLHDAYLSVSEALVHAGIANGAHVEIDWVQSEYLTDENADELLGGVQGIIVPGGFGARGAEGMIVASRYARTNGIPYFGICMGMQTAVIEFARNVLGIKEANSAEFCSKEEFNVISYMPDHSGCQIGGTMRLGSYPCHIKEGSLMYDCYKTKDVCERHRHRCEFNNKFRDEFVAAGMIFSGTGDNNILVEAVELPGHPFFIGVQFHPELKAVPTARILFLRLLLRRRQSMCR
ncbi:ctp synthase [Holotrichia oblita]|nr:ctp synthase [Holotrichia oblita]